MIDDIELTLEQLRTFVAVCEEGSVSRAAQRLDVPKSTVSRRIARLEEIIGVRVLRRDAGPLQVTDAGRQLLEPAGKLLEDALRLAAGFRALQDQPQGRLRVSAPIDLAGERAAWVDFAARYPEISLELSFTNRYVDVVDEGFDIALRGGPGLDERLTGRRIGTYDLWAVASPEYAARRGRPGSRDQLTNHDCLLLQPLRTHEMMERETRRAVETGQLFVANDLEAIIHAARRGLGVAFLPACVCGQDLAEGRLVPMLDEYAPFEVPVFAVYPDRQYLPAAVRVFLEFVSERLGPSQRTTVLATPIDGG